MERISSTDDLNDLTDAKKRAVLEARIRIQNYLGRSQTGDGGIKIESYDVDKLTDEDILEGFVDEVADQRTTLKREILDLENSLVQALAKEYGYAFMTKAPWPMIQAALKGEAMSGLPEVIRRLTQELFKLNMALRKMNQGPLILADQE